MIDKINFNKRIKYNDIETGSLVWVNFGETKHLFLKEMERQLKEECFNIQDCPHGLNLLHEFSYYHMAFLVSNKFNDTVAVVPLVGTQRIWPARAFTLGHLTHNDLASVRI